MDRIISPDQHGLFQPQAPVPASPFMDIRGDSLRDGTTSIVGQEAQDLVSRDTMLSRPQDAPLRQAENGSRVVADELRDAVELKARPERRGGRADDLERSLHH